MSNDVESAENGETLVGIGEDVAIEMASIFQRDTLQSLLSLM